MQYVSFCHSRWCGGIPGLISPLMCAGDISQICFLKLKNKIAKYIILSCASKSRSYYKTIVLYVEQ